LKGARGKILSKFSPAYNTSITYLLLQKLQCAGRAFVDAKVTVGASGDLIWSVELRLDHGREAASHDAEKSALCDLVADSVTETAKDALGGVALNDDELVLGRRDVLLPLQAFGMNFVFICVFY